MYPPLYIGLKTYEPRLRMWLALPRSKTRVTDFIAVMVATNLYGIQPSATTFNYSSTCSYRLASEITLNYIPITPPWRPLSKYWKLQSVKFIYCFIPNATAIVHNDINYSTSHIRSRKRLLPASSSTRLTSCIVWIATRDSSQKRTHFDVRKNTKLRHCYGILCPKRHKSSS